jgi:hypothetical protein
VRRSLLLLALVAAGGCAPAAKPPEGPIAAGPIEPDLLLTRLRERSAAVRSFHATGTFYVRTDREKHFLHFEGWFQRPDRSRLDIDLPGFPGFDPGRLSFLRVGEEIACVAARSGEEEREVPPDSALAFLSAYGLRAATAPYLLAPYSGPEEILRPEHVVACSRLSGGRARLVLNAGGGGREVLELGPALDLLERRVVDRGSEVLLVCSYTYEDGAVLFAREVEAFLPREGAHLTTRFRILEGNVPVPQAVFVLPTE